MTDTYGNTYGLTTLEDGTVYPTGDFENLQHDPRAVYPSPQADYAEMSDEDLAEAFRHTVEDLNIVDPATVRLLVEVYARLAGEELVQLVVDGYEDC